MIAKVKKKQACFLPKLFEPSGVNQLFRLGSAYRGGYVIATEAVANSTSLLSAGIDSLLEFELDFAAMAPLTRLRLYDPSADGECLRKAYLRARFGQLFRRTPERRRSISLFRNFQTLFDTGGKNHAANASRIGTQAKEVPLGEAIAAMACDPGTLFLKCSLTGGEYDILDQIIENNHLLSGMVLALHDVPAHLREIQVFLTAMRDFMWLDNTAADNSAGVNGDGIPNRVELSMSTPRENIPPLPIPAASKDFRQMNAPHDPGRMELEVFYV